MGRLTVLKQIASDLASQFGPDCEIVIHDLKTNDPEHSIVSKSTSTGSAIPLAKCLAS